MSARQLAAGTVLAVVLALAAGLAHRQPPPALETAASNATADSRAVAETLVRADPSSTMLVAFTLRHVDHAGANAFLRASSDRSSPLYGTGLSLAGFGARFGAPEPDIELVTGFLRSAGLKVLPVEAQRILIQAEGDVATFEKLLQIEILEPADPAAAAMSGRTPSRRPTIPSAISGAVSAVIGFGEDRPSSMFPGTFADVPGWAMKPAQLRVAYGIQPLIERGIDGTGQTIGVLGWDTFLDADLATWMGQFGGDVNQVTRVIVPVGEPQPKPGGGSIETNLDIQSILAVAPNVKVFDFDGIWRMLGSWAPLVSAALAPEYSLDAISISYGGCELLEDKDEANATYRHEARLATEDQFAAAEAAGINIFVSSGDVGALSCDHAVGPADLNPATEWPASSDHVIAVGGTFLRLRADGSYFDESAWESSIGFLGSGGGRSQKYARPVWQVASGISATETGRMLPDVSGPADSDSGLYVYCICGKDDPQEGWSQGSGTSQAAPFWAGYSALLRQGVGDANALRLRDDGKLTLKGLPEALYGVAGSTAPNTVFHDITLGGNLYEPAAPGWDTSTGLGTPIGDALFDAVVEWYRTHP